MLLKFRQIVHEGQTERMEAGVNKGIGQELTDELACVGNFVCLCGECCFVRMEVWLNGR